MTAPLPDPYRPPGVPPSPDGDDEPMDLTNQMNHEEYYGWRRRLLFAGAVFAIGTVAYFFFFETRFGYYKQMAGTMVSLMFGAMIMTFVVPVVVWSVFQVVTEQTRVFLFALVAAACASPWLYMMWRVLTGQV